MPKTHKVLVTPAENYTLCGSNEDEQAKAMVQTYPKPQRDKDF